LQALAKVENQRGRMTEAQALTRLAGALQSENSLDSARLRELIEATDE
jgi:hypothetical protein